MKCENSNIVTLRNVKHIFVTVSCDHDPPEPFHVVMSVSDKCNVFTINETVWFEHQLQISLPQTGLELGHILSRHHCAVRGHTSVVYFQRQR